MNPDGSFDTDPVVPVTPQASAGLMLAGRYRLEALLAQGRGIMTWRAADTVLSRSVLMHLLAAESERLGWVLQAARQAATISDSRFLRVLDALEASGQEPWSFVVCEYAVGDSVQNLLSDQSMTAQQAGFIVHEIATALAPMHARGLFHLRISPDSVIITANGNVKIVGFLIDAALRPKPGENSLSWSDQESIDVHGLGSLLYGITTGRWPVPPNEPQVVTWGLPPAPMASGGRAGGPGEQLWASPHELNSAIDPEFSAVIMAILRPRLGLVGPGLHTAEEIADALEQLAGNGEAEESLETLVRAHRGLAAHSPTPAIRKQRSEWPTATSEDQPTQQMLVADVWDGMPDTDPNFKLGDDLDATAQQPVATAPSISSKPTQPEAVAPQPVKSPVAERPKPVAAPPRLPQRRTTAALGRRGVLLLIGFIVIALVVLQIRSCADGGSTQAPITGSATENGSVASGPVAISSAFDFDPPADGGDNNENGDQAKFAADGDPATVWRTLTYLNNPVFGGLKPGVGIVYDLGSAVPVESVSLTLDNQPNGLQLMVPIEADPQAAKPPMATVKQWRAIATDQAAASQVTLQPDEPVTTRWVMVYFTHLPAIGSGLYRSGITETTING